MTVWILRYSNPDNRSLIIGVYLTYTGAEKAARNTLPDLKKWIKTGPFDFKREDEILCLREWKVIE